MGCNCGAGKTPTQTWTLTDKDGNKIAYKTKSEADAAQVRRGGTVKPS